MYVSRVPQGHDVFATSAKPHFTRLSLLPSVTKDLSSNEAHPPAMAYIFLWRYTNRPIDRPGQDRNQKLPYNLDREAIQADLTPSNQPKGEKPEWPLSAYGPGREAPRQLIEGSLEQSPEEMRVLYYLAASEGKLGEYQQQELQLRNQAQQQAQAILSDIDKAIQYVIDGEQQHPNRLDQVVKEAGSARSQPAGFGHPSSSGGALGFGEAATPAASSPFGHFSGRGQQRPAFGQPSQPAGATAFGQPPSVGSGPAFGQPSAIGDAKPAFGGSSQPAGGNAFGAPARPNSGGNAFGAPSALGQRPAFGQPSQPAFGQSAFGHAPKTAFGQPSQPAQQASPFGGQASNPSPFAAANQQPSGFGQAIQAQPQQASSFGQETVFGQSSASPFGAGQTAGSAFGAPSQPTGSPSGQPSQPSNSGFGQPPSSSATHPAFGSTNGFSSQPNGVSPAPTNMGHLINGDAVGISATLNHTTRTADGKTLMTWGGHPVTYDREENPPVPFFRNPQTGKRERIWHPDGPPDRPNEYAESAPEVYSGDIGAILKGVYDHVRDNEAFKDMVPEIPPKREWIRWDL
ncbi:hypothetical protein BAUCODRAFT_30495 [Baudoinia panamericana UAMH 10762]|uniref:Uncharacterized protein n=1 Tax=Baudoinia panamericana (strain UAMH 10762) TaxID=717646 RepID=M2LZE4_BAUPA|nr:uncharacterized protein BAUCODRAFT_30495 [Baudoinia panamericana UAMH 10762]EMD00048.1 hypothetical protein BAUCODRAFT_30495 [Baudoinia panamericana UAMH 10762]